jgi:predicted dehydrogenase
MSKPRAIVIGVGAQIFDQHRCAFEDGIFELAGVTDVNDERARRVAAEFGCASYPTVERLLAETQPDLAVILTPHLWHAPIGIECLEAKTHVFVEKPLALHIGEADDLITAAADAQRLLAVCLQHRLRPEIREARRLILRGAIGSIQRVTAIQAWTRTNAYYSQSPWRGTWAGEGGGAAMTLAIHHLDLFYHLFGMPARVAGWTRNILHTVGTEDTVHALLEWHDGILGFLHISSGEAGSPEQIEIVGTAGKLQIGSGTLTVWRFAADVRDHVETHPNPYGAVASAATDDTRFDAAPGHLGIYQNLLAAIVGRTPLVADGRDGRASLELANAILYSSQMRGEVELPLESDTYAAFLSALIERSQSVS